MSDIPQTPQEANGALDAAAPRMPTAPVRKPGVPPLHGAPNTAAPTRTGIVAPGPKRDGQPADAKTSHVVRNDDAGPTSGSTAGSKPTTAGSNASHVVRNDADRRVNEMEDLDGLPVDRPRPARDLDDSTAHGRDFLSVRATIETRLTDIVRSNAPARFEPGTNARKEATLATENLYRSRAVGLRRRFLLTTGVDPDKADALDFVHWFLSMRSDYKASSWRFMRQVAWVAILAFDDQEKVRKASLLIDGDGQQDAHLLTQKRKDPKRKLVTSELKQKYVDHDDLVRLDAHFRTKSKSDNSMNAVNLLRASIMTGLRPAEWATCVVSEVPDENEARGHRTYLFVLNAKANTARGNGTMRTIDLTRFTDAGIREVKTMAEMGTAWNATGQFQDRIDQASSALYRACRKLWPKRAKCYALYSGRHQFKLNMASLDLPPEDIAALMGHNVTETHTKHYGVRFKAWSIDKILNRPAPVADEVTSVRLTLEQFKLRKVLERVALGKKPEIEDDMDLDTTEERIEPDARFEMDTL